MAKKKSSKAKSTSASKASGPSKKKTKSKASEFGSLKIRKLTDPIQVYGCIGYSIPARYVPTMIPGYTC